MYVDVIDDAISPSSVRAVIIYDVFEIIRLWGHWLHVEKNFVIYIPFYGLPMKSYIGNINAHTLLNKNSRKLLENIVHI